MVAVDSDEKLPAVYIQLSSRPCKSLQFLSRAKIRGAGYLGSLVLVFPGCLLQDPLHNLQEPEFTVMHWSDIFP